jgi:hypothetical protein
MCVTKRTSKENWLMTVVAQILDRMSGVAKPQRKFLLTLFVAMLVTRTRLNFLNLSRHSSVHEKTYRHLLREIQALKSGHCVQHELDAVFVCNEREKISVGAIFKRIFTLRSRFLTCWPFLIVNFCTLAADTPS